MYHSAIDAVDRHNGQPQRWGSAIVSHNLNKVARILTMPEDGIGPVRELLETARRSLHIKLFTFDEPALVEATIAAHRRGVAVSVLLNPAKFSGMRMNDETYAAFREAGIDVNWTSPKFSVSHEKSVVVDRSLVLISTFNFSPKYFEKTRDYGVLLDDPDAIAAILACFEADRKSLPFAAPDYGPLAWGNLNARRVVAEVIDGARKHLAIQHPKFNDDAILDRVLAAVARGVRVRFLCGGHQGIEDWDLMANLSCQRILARAGVRLRKQNHLRQHAKLLLADGERAMLGSMNIDSQAYDQRRELGVVFDDPAAVKQLKKQFAADWKAAKAYTAEDPLERDLPALLSKRPCDACGNDPAVTHD